MSTTFANLIQFAQDQTADQNDARAVRKQKRAINNAFRRIARTHDWSFYIPTAGGRINFIAAYDTGTLALTQGSNTAVLTGGVWPAGAVGRKVVASSNPEVEFEVATRTNDTDVIFITGQNWLDDSAAASTYGIYADVYDLPDGFRKFLEGKGETQYLHFMEPPDFRLYKQGRRNSADDPPSMYTVIANRQVQVYEYPSTASVWQFMYCRMPTELSADEDVMDWDEDLLDIAHAAIKVELVIEFGSKLLNMKLRNALGMYDTAAAAAWEDDSTRVRTFDTWGLETEPRGPRGPRPLGLITDE